MYITNIEHYTFLIINFIKFIILCRFFVKFNIIFLYLAIINKFPFL